jgi:8-amino-7-oxononanoate synthase
MERLAQALKQVCFTRWSRLYNSPVIGFRESRLTGFSDIKTALDEREQLGLYRRRRTVASAQGRELVVNGIHLLNFCSNDYLGLANDERIRVAFKKGIDDWGAGSGAAHLVSGHTSAHHELEVTLADFTGRPRSLLFASGYAANLGTINALVGSGDHVFEDRLNHASLLDGGLISGARLQRYQHRDTEDLAAKLGQTNTANKRTLVVSDGTFSMDGTTCDIAATAEVTREHGAWLMVDEAHSLGVLGEQGRGLVDPQRHDTDSVQLLIGTLGKAFGTQGGFVAGSEELIETLIQQARTYIYSTALPAAVAVATLASLKIVAEEGWRRERLVALIGEFREGARKLGLELLDSTTAIQPVILGDEHSALNMSAALEEEGLMITPIRPPTVPAGTSRLRITFTAAHTDDDLGKLLGGLEKVLNS